MSDADDAPRPGTVAARRARAGATTPEAGAVRSCRSRSLPGPSGDRRPPGDRSTGGRSSGASDDGHDSRDRLDPVDPGTPPHGTPAPLGAPVARDETTAFLLQSLRDLEREHAAGDIDDADYEALRDEYTARAAVALQAEERGKAPPVPKKVGRTPLQWTLIIVGIVGFAVLAGVLVAQASGQRQTGEGITGDVALTPTQAAGECLTLSAQVQAGAASPQDALACYQEVLDEDPDNPVARTYLGWTLYLTARAGGDVFGDDELVELYVQARRQVELGAEADPSYPDARAFLIVLAVQSGEYEEAAEHLAVFDELDAPADMASLVDTVRDDVEEGLAGDAAPGDDGGDDVPATTPGDDAPTTTAGG